MQTSTENRHVYQRSITEGIEDSLSLIAAMVSSGDVLLDLGVGSGALGQYLKERKDVVCDGVTYNPAEEALAKEWYRQTKVLDLDTVDLATAFPEGAYDNIVCADVLEHLKNPQLVLAACKRLLKPGGRILASVPNAGYCGLVAELMQGEFRYRMEGLLDNTHLRFFTRKSLKRVFRECKLEIVSFEVTRRPLSESEFRTPFDNFPQGVANYLLAMPDALTYQFICALRDPDNRKKGDVPVPERDEQADKTEVTSMDAVFSAAVYLAKRGEFQESTKLICAGRIGAVRQTLTFDIPGSTEPYTAIRLDPADRPGFLRLHGMRLTRLDGTLLWEWASQTDSISILAQTESHHLVMLGESELFAGAAIALTGNDPWFALPFTHEWLGQISDGGGRLELSVGWPMSADYSHAEHILRHQNNEHKREQTVWNEQMSKAVNEYSELAANHALVQHQLTETFHVNENIRLEKTKLIQELRAAQRENIANREYAAQVAVQLEAIKASSVFRFTRPLVQMKERFDRIFRNVPEKLPIGQQKSNGRRQPKPNQPVDIIIPVYKGLSDTRRCLESVLSARCTTPSRLVVINDCSPESEVTEWLRDLARRNAKVILVENPENKGFVATVNVGMAMSAENDVVLLNSDTEVANDWLDRLRAAAYGDSRVATVTPFSNNATICSYPGFCRPNELPAGSDTASLDCLFSKYLSGQTLEVPTGVGFCMYLTRASLDEVGFFDEESFGKGYGEENDFCIRAQNAGWKNLHALDTFVRHAGGVSFGDSKNERELQAMETLRRLHPRYESQVHAFVRDDPARLARFTADLARILGQNRPVILNVVHDREGGTLRHVRDLAAFLGDRAVFLTLAPVPGGVSLRLEGENTNFALGFSLPHEYPTMLNALRALRVVHIHFHHLLGQVPEIVKLPDELGVTHDFTAHDYYSYCPQISLTDHTDRYCGEIGLDQCRQCLKRGPAPYGETIDEWRDRHAPLLSRARYLITPSADTAQRFSKFVPGSNLRVVPHSSIAENPISYGAPVVQPMSTDRPLRIAVLGALSKIKGADLLEAVAQLAAKENAPVEFHLLGYAYRNLRTQPRARLTVHGAYEDKDLHQLLDWLSPDVVWFPALWPETYSYTLSASLESCLPIVAPDIGAFSERLHARSWSWLLHWAMPAKEVLDFFVGIRLRHFLPGVGPEPHTGQILPVEGSGALCYRGDYVEELKSLEPVDAQELSKIRDQLIGLVLRQKAVDAGPASIKLSVFNAIKRLRASPLLSPLARLIPLSMQRRVKSWLKR